MNVLIKITNALFEITNVLFEITNVLLEITNKFFSISNKMFVISKIPYSRVLQFSRFNRNVLPVCHICHGSKYSCDKHIIYSEYSTIALFINLIFYNYFTHICFLKIKFFNFPKFVPDINNYCLKVVLLKNMNITNIFL